MLLCGTIQLQRKKERKTSHLIFFTEELYDISHQMRVHISACHSPTLLSRDEPQYIAGILGRQCGRDRGKRERGREGGREGKIGEEEQDRDRVQRERMVRKGQKLFGREKGDEERERRPEGDRGGGEGNVTRDK